MKEWKGVAIDRNTNSQKLRVEAKEQDRKKQTEYPPKYSYWVSLSLGAKSKFSALWYRKIRTTKSDPDSVKALDKGANLKELPTAKAGTVW